MSPADFENLMRVLPDISRGGKVAAAVSGGPDSMAMLWLLSRWAERCDVQIHAYTVDHALRRESAEEAAQVGAWVKDWPHVKHRVLLWEGEKPDAGILEEARTVRYDLIAQAMARDGATCLFVAHHADDQAETFLLRLAKGSGLDGLSCMRPAQARGQITLLRPLLGVSKEDLIRLCMEKNIPYVRDPTNENNAYTRPRLRAARSVLETEGLSAQRLCKAATRMARAQDALEKLACGFYKSLLIRQNETLRVFDYEGLEKLPDEIILRILLRAMEELAPAQGYGPRLEKAENLLGRLLDKDFRGATLGGCRFVPDRAKNHLKVEKE